MIDSCGHLLVVGGYCSTHLESVGALQERAGLPLGVGLQQLGAELQGRGELHQLWAGLTLQRGVGLQQLEAVLQWQGVELNWLGAELQWLGVELQLGAELGPLLEVGQWVVAGLEEQLQEVGQVLEQVGEELQQLGAELQQLGAESQQQVGAESLLDVGVGSRVQWAGLLPNQGEGLGLVSEAGSDD